MARLTAKRRRRLKKNQYGLPGSRKYPVDTKARARSAKAYAAKEHKAGRLSKSSKDRINAKANKRLRRKS